MTLQFRRRPPCVLLPSSYSLVLPALTRHTSFTVVTSTERAKYIQLIMQQRLLQLLKTFRHSIYVLMIVVLYCFLNLALNLGVSTLIDTRNWRQWKIWKWCYSVRTVNETFDQCDVTARSSSHLVMSSRFPSKPKRNNGRETNLWTQVFIGMIRMIWNMSSETRMENGWTIHSQIHDFLNF